jgi:membrane-associated protease RseP (regulator of RpoE activity)
MILGAHEMGHYLAARLYGVRATLPYFLPAPVGVGTFGAFIKMKSPIPNKRALFDIGIAGPLAGFVFIIPAAFIGLYFADPAVGVIGGGGAGIVFHDPLLFRAIAKLLGVPRDIEANPIWLASWVGCLVTSLNLLPVGQLDGGHVVYAAFGARWHWLIARLVYVGVIALTVASYFWGGWMGWAVYVVILTLMLRVGHPRVMDEDESLGFGRMIVTIIGLLVFLLCFMPAPITF